MKYFLQLTRHKYSLPVRILVSLCGGALFAFLIPYSLIWYFPRFDGFFHITRIFAEMVNLVIGCLMILTGFFFAMWSIYSQLAYAGGSPIPIVATQKLLVSGPFRQCRNPMGFGAITAYVGISIMVGSIASLIAVSLFAAFFIMYVRLFEEKELEARFGEEYRLYKKSTPFIIPGIKR